MIEQIVNEQRALSPCVSLLEHSFFTVTHCTSSRTYQKISDFFLQVTRKLISVLLCAFSVAFDQVTA